ncbi:MAG: hypothetical protein JOZ39_10020, partial [Chloroflexi bacterium]|nr:hypothetical protein [Chloroflexota bacterium]
KAKAIEEAGPSMLYFNTTLFSHGNVTDASPLMKTGYISTSSLDYVRPENLAAAERSRVDFRNLTLSDIAKQAENWAWGEAAEVRDRIIDEADHAGASTLLVSLNRGALPHELFLDQIRRFAAEVLPVLQAHEVRSVPAAV